MVSVLHSRFFLLAHLLSFLWTVFNFLRLLLKAWMLGPVGEGLSGVLVDCMMGRISDKEGMDRLSLLDEE